MAYSIGQGLAQAGSAIGGGITQLDERQRREAKEAEATALQSAMEKYAAQLAADPTKPFTPTNAIEQRAAYMVEPQRNQAMQAYINMNVPQATEAFYAAHIPRDGVGPLPESAAQFQGYNPQVRSAAMAQVGAADRKRAQSEAESQTEYDRKLAIMREQEAAATERARIAAAAMQNRAETSAAGRAASQDKRFSLGEMARVREALTSKITALDEMARLKPELDKSTLGVGSGAIAQLSGRVGLTEGTTAATANKLARTVVDLKRRQITGMAAQMSELKDIQNKYGNMNQNRDVLYADLANQAQEELLAAENQIEIMLASATNPKDIEYLNSARDKLRASAEKAFAAYADGGAPQVPSAPTAPPAQLGYYKLPDGRTVVADAPEDVASLPEGSTFIRPK